MTFSSRLRACWRLRRHLRSSNDKQSALQIHIPSIRSDCSIRIPGTDLDTLSEIFVHRVYEGIICREKDPSYIVDLGANIGLATLYMANAFPRSSIFAVEPDPGNYAILKRNVAGLVAKSRCTTVNAAVWGRDTSLVAGIPTAGGYDAIQVRESTGHALGNGNQVEGMSMDSIFAASRFPRIDVLKIDIEGAETQLFQGNLNWLDKVSTIAIEFHGTSRDQSGFDAAVEAHGFSVEAGDHRHTLYACRR